MDEGPAGVRQPVASHGDALAALSAARAARAAGNLLGEAIHEMCAGVLLLEGEAANAAAGLPSTEDALSMAHMMLSQAASSLDSQHERFLARDCLSLLARELTAANALAAATPVWHRVAELSAASDPARLGAIFSAAECTARLHLWPAAATTLATIPAPPPTLASAAPHLADDGFAVATLHHRIYADALCARVACHILAGAAAPAATLADEVAAFVEGASHPAVTIVGLPLGYEACRDLCACATADDPDGVDAAARVVAGAAIGTGSPRVGLVVYLMGMVRAAALQPPPSPLL